MVRTGRDLVPLRKPKISKPKELKKLKYEIKKATECKRKDMGKIRKQVRDQGGNRRLEAKLKKRLKSSRDYSSLW